MPSPFPGMDPYIEMFEWDDFHPRAMLIACDLIAAQLPPGYVARVERRSYLEMELDQAGEESSRRAFYPDVSVSHSGSRTDSAPSTAMLVEPLRQRIATTVERHETFLEIREVATRIVITAFELLSPSNKRVGSVGGQLYAKKRLTVLESETNFVELDLLRSGRRILISKPGLPADCDYYALISRAEERPDVDPFAWSLPQRMPVIPVPLKREDGHVPLDLQQVLNIAYERVHYEATLDYRVPLSPPVRPTDDAWLQSVLESVTASQTKSNA